MERDELRHATLPKTHHMKMTTTTQLVVKSTVVPQRSARLRDRSDKKKTILADQSINQSVNQLIKGIGSEGAGGGGGSPAQPSERFHLL